MTTLVFQKTLGVLVVFAALALFTEKDSSDKSFIKKLPGHLKRTLLGNKITLLLVLIFFISISHINIASGSMEPTLMTGDKGFVIDAVFGYKPHRGDIVSFTVGKEIWIKRVIGLPGDVVEIHDGAVYINGEKLDEDYLEPGLYTQAGNQESYTVPEKHIFVLGDNRNGSFDSRYWEDPYVSNSRVVGKYIGTLFHSKK